MKVDFRKRLLKDTFQCKSDLTTFSVSTFFDMLRRVVRSNKVGCTIRGGVHVDRGVLSLVGGWAWEGKENFSWLNYVFWRILSKLV